MGEGSHSQSPHLLILLPPPTSPVHPTKIHWITLHCIAVGPFLSGIIEINPLHGSICNDVVSFCQGSFKRNLKSRSSWLTYRWCFPAPLTVDDDDVRSSATLLWESSSESISGHVVMICLLSTCWKKVFWGGIWGQVHLAKQKRFWEYELSYFWWTHRYRCWLYSEQYHFCQPAAVWCIFLSWGHFVPPQIVSGLSPDLFQWRAIVRRRPSPPRWVATSSREWI